MDAQTTGMRIAVDLTTLGQADFRLRLVRGLVREAPDIAWTLLCSAATASLGRLNAPNVHVVAVAEPTPLELVRARVKARLTGVLPYPLRALPSSGRADPRRAPSSKGPANRQHPWGGDRRSQVRADVLFCPFTARGVSAPSTPLVAAVYDLSHVSSPHLLRSRERAVRARALAATVAGATRVVCSGEDVRLAAASLDGMPPADRLRTIAPGRLLAPPPPTPAAIAACRARYGSPSLVMFGGDARSSNYRLVLTAFGLLRARRPDSRLTLVCAPLAGAGSAAQLHADVAAMALTDTVHVLDDLPDDDVAPLIAASSGVLDASLYDTVGDTLLQAMILGQPVIASDLPAHVDLAADARLTFDPRRPTDLLAALERFEFEPGLARRLGQLACARVMALDSPTTVADAYLGVLREAAWRTSSR